ncbi:hypothetical protein [Kitasatospora griseola]|uniref:hypothetical protein n=1 Tax=Kitasatospora griseola TaxID=2064 RepID=UPI003825150A
MTHAARIAAPYPRLRERIGTTGYADAPENTFHFGLHAILDGLTTRLAQRTTEH